MKFTVQEIQDIVDKTLTDAGIRQKYIAFIHKNWSGPGLCKYRLKHILIAENFIESNTRELVLKVIS